MTVADPYDCAAGMFNELAAHGVTRCLLSPGSRSTPLAIAASAVEAVDVEIHLDERSAAFWAVGAAKASGRPVALVCTSGTAAANYLPAVVEAHYSGTPLIVITADRPPELRDRGAGQTIDQVGIYGNNVRWFVDLPVAGEADPRWFASTAARAVRAATGPRPGPVHLNAPFREPLEPRKGWVPNPPATVDLAHRDPIGGPTAVEALNHAAANERGLVLAGPMTDDHFDDVVAFCRRTGWPLLAEPLSQLRRTADDVVTLAHHDHLLRTDWADRHIPEVVVRVGDPMTCKPLRLWLEGHRPHHVLVDAGADWTDASVTATSVVTADPSVLAHVTSGHGPRAWAKAWSDADASAIVAADAILDAGPLMEAAIARELGRSLPAESALMVSNSMPVRDLDSFLRPTRHRLHCYGNRGASGIDGIVSTAAGIASTGRSTTLYVGDLAVLHDIGGLLSVVEHAVDLTVVVANNDGGGIFSFLPIAVHDEVPFERLFTTPQSHSLGPLVTAAGGTHEVVHRQRRLAAALGEPATGLRVLEVPIDRAANVDQHRAVAGAISTSLGR